MARLYIFAIGGSGARVIRSLTMLFAAGLKPGNFDEVLPILIDPDEKNGSLAKTNDLLNRYLDLKCEAKEFDFFKTKLTGLHNGNFYFDVPKIKNSAGQDVDPTTSFGDYIGHDDLKGNTLDLIELLFSGKVSDGNSSKLLKLPMNKGFVGNPNIGSVVMSNFVNSPTFDEFVSGDNAINARNGDRVLFITSIFGGTGAAGFPAILNKIRNYKDASGVAKTDVTGAIIGSITMLPYFNVGTIEGGGGVNSSAFIPKTKSALLYYKESVYNQVQSFYYVGMDNPQTTFANEIGGKAQKNRALFAEFVAALAVFDFAQMETENLTPKNKYKQFYDLPKAEKINISSLLEKQKKNIESPFRKLFMLKEYLEKKLQSNINAKREWTGKRGGETEADMSKINKMKDFIEKELNPWLEELGSDGTDAKPIPKFIPFSNFNFGNIDEFSVILDEKSKEVQTLIGAKSNAEYVPVLLNLAIKEQIGGK
jgi:hypothetical protein